MSLETLLKNYSEAQAKFRAEAQEAFKEEVKNLFQAVPKLKVVKWNQFIPSFNDGDPCTFKMTDIVYSNCPDHSKISGYGEIEDMDEDEYEEAFGEFWATDSSSLKVDSDLSPEEVETVKAFDKVISSYTMHDVLEATFGSDATVTCTPEEVFTEEYYCGY